MHAFRRSGAFFSPRCVSRPHSGSAFFIHTLRVILTATVPFLRAVQAIPSMAVHFFRTGRAFFVATTLFLCRTRCPLGSSLLFGPQRVNCPHSGGALFLHRTSYPHSRTLFSAPGKLFSRRHLFFTPGDLFPQPRLFHNRRVTRTAAHLSPRQVSCSHSGSK